MKNKTLIIFTKIYAAFMAFSLVINLLIGSFAAIGNLLGLGLSFYLIAKYKETKGNLSTGWKILGGIFTFIVIANIIGFFIIILQ